VFISYDTDAEEFIDLDQKKSIDETEDVRIRTEREKIGV
jgi:hypothetical protein